MSLTLLPSQVQRTDLRVEVAVGAALDADPSMWTFTDVTPDLDSQSLTIPHGSTGDSSEPEPATVTFQLDNRSGRYTPDDPRTEWWPDFDVDTPIRLTLPAGTALQLDGRTARAWTADTAALDITTDITIGVEAVGRIEVPPADLICETHGKFNAGGGQRSWLDFLYWGRPWLRWSTNGTAGGELDAHPPERLPPNTRAYYAHLDVNNGAGGHTVKFYAGQSLAAIRANPTAHLFGEWVASGTTSIHSGTAPLEIGDITNSSFPAYRGRIAKLEVRAGDLNGDLRADPHFDEQPPGTTSFTDSVGRLWNIDQGATITDRATVLIGQITSIRPTWPYGDLSDPDNPEDIPGEAQVTITVTGPLRNLQQVQQPLDSTLYRRITSPAVAANVIAHWAWEDEAGASSIASSTPGVAPAAFAGVQLASNSSLPSSKPLPSVSSGGFAWLATVPSLNLTSWRVDLYTYIGTPDADEMLIFEIATTGTVRRWQLSISNAAIIIRGYDVDGNLVVNPGGVVTDPGDFNRWARWSITLDQDGGNIDWTWGEVWVGGFVFGAAGTLAGTVGRITTIGTFTVAPPGGVSWGHAVVSTGLPPDWLEDTAFNNGAGTGFLGETAGDRFDRLGEEEDFPVEVTGNGAFNYLTERLGPQPIDTPYGVQHKAAEADGGIHEELGDRLGVGYRIRRSLYNQHPLVLDARHNEHANPFEPTKDARPRQNVVKVTRDGGSSATRTTVPPPKKLNEHKVEVALNLWSDHQLDQHAAWRLHLGTTTGMRYPTLTVDLTVAPHLADLVLSLRVGDRVQVINLPPQHPPGPVDLIIKGRSVITSPTTLEVEFACAPAGPWTVGVVDDPVLGRADTDGSQLHAAPGATGTSFDVAVTDGPMWTTDDAEFPFKARVHGEIVNVTDIAASLVTFGATGTAAHANNASVTPGLPAGLAAGNLLGVLAGIRNSGVPNTPAGYVRLPVFNDGDNVQLFAKVAGSSEVAPTITFAGGVAGADTSAQMIRLGGQWADPANIVATAVATLNSSGQDIAYPDLAVPEPNCIILYLGWKQDDWTSVATIAGATEIGEPSTTTGNDQGLVWDYLIQTTAARIPAGSFVVTGGAAAISRGAAIALRCDRQTWTVQRSLNDVVREHTVATPISLATPMVAAL